MTSFRIAIAQTSISRDVRENGQSVRRSMRDAAAAGARLVLFPEGCLSGYAKAQITDWGDVDWPAVRDELRGVMSLAADLGLWVALGSAHPLTPPHRPHNSVYVISDAGRIVDRYDKRLCSPTEIRHFYAPGFSPVVFDIDGFRFGCAICVEINYPELFAEYEALGVDCVLLPAYPIDTIFEVKARAHAAINNYWVAMSTPAQTAHLMNSELIAPNGDILVRVAEGSELIVGDLDRDDPRLHIALNAARPWRSLAREGAVYRDRRVEDRRSSDRSSV